jgi:hypothetical protein
MPDPLPGRQILVLDGSWSLCADPDDVGRDEAWFATPPDTGAVTATTPSFAQEVLPHVEDVLWYWRRIDALPAPVGRRAVLSFGAVDYAADVWVNGRSVGQHEGGETSFALDVTEALGGNGDDLVVVRVAMASADGHTGYPLLEVAHRNRENPFRAGASWNVGGITGTVSLQLEEAVRIGELFVRSTPGAATTDVTLTVDGVSAPTQAQVRVTVAADSPTAGDGPGTLEFDSGPLPVDLQPTRPLDLSLATGPLAVWGLDDPRLHRATVEITVDGHTVSGSSRFGVRDFRLAGGRFVLNGTPVFLRMTHTVNDYPWTDDPAATLGRLRQDLIHLKATGFTMARFIWGDARTQQLDLCDEIGLLVYEETFASWAMADSPALSERMTDAITDIVRRDRHHPSVVVWGLLNEAHDGAAVDLAVGLLDALVELDGTRLIALNSGRWDSRADLGSFANPGSRKWDGYLGNEGSGAADDELGWRPGASPIAVGAAAVAIGRNLQAVGDVHPYPIVPHTAAVIDFLRRVGEDSRLPVFVSEYGVGSTVDLWRTARHFEHAGRADAQDAVFYAECLDRFEQDWQRWSLDAVFGHRSRFFALSLDRMARERAVGIDALRSNPHVNGYGLTGAVDQVMCGEGLATTFRELKPHVADDVAGSLAPVRLCVFTSAHNIYSGDDVRLDVVLASEVDLGDADLPVTVQVYGPDGAVCWSETVTAGAPVTGSNVAQDVRPVLTGVALPTEGAAGTHVVRAFLEHGAAATASTMEVTVFERAVALDPPACLVIGDETAVSRLRAAGLDATRWTGGTGDAQLIVWSSDQGAHDAAVVFCRSASERGAAILCLNPAVFDLLSGADVPDGVATTIPSWLYERDDWGHRHPVFDGLPFSPLLDWDSYRELITDRIYKPGDESGVEAIAGVLRASQDYDSGLTIWSATVANGVLLGCSYGLELNAGRHPVADALLTNMARHLTGATQARVAVGSGADA